MRLLNLKAHLQVTTFSSKALLCKPTQTVLPTVDHVLNAQVYGRNFPPNHCIYEMEAT